MPVRPRNPLDVIGGLLPQGIMQPKGSLLPPSLLGRQRKVTRRGTQPTQPALSQQIQQGAQGALGGPAGAVAARVGALAQPAPLAGTTPAPPATPSPPGGAPRQTLGAIPAGVNIGELIGRATGSNHPTQINLFNQLFAQKSLDDIVATLLSPEWVDEWGTTPAQVRALLAQIQQVGGGGIAALPGVEMAAVPPSAGMALAGPTGMTAPQFVGTGPAGVGGPGVTIQVQQPAGGGGAAPLPPSSYLPTNAVINQEGNIVSPGQVVGGGFLGGERVIGFEQPTPEGGTTFRVAGRETPSTVSLFGGPAGEELPFGLSEVAEGEAGSTSITSLVRQQAAGGAGGALGAGAGLAAGEGGGFPGTDLATTTGATDALAAGSGVKGNPALIAAGATILGSILGKSEAPPPASTLNIPPQFLPIVEDLVRQAAEEAQGGGNISPRITALRSDTDVGLDRIAANMLTSPNPWMQAAGRAVQKVTGDVSPLGNQAMAYVSRVLNVDPTTGLDQQGMAELAADEADIDYQTEQAMAQLQHQLGSRAPSVDARGVLVGSSGGAQLYSQLLGEATRSKLRARVEARAGFNQRAQNALQQAGFWDQLQAEKPIRAAQALIGYWQSTTNLFQQIAGMVQAGQQVDRALIQQVMDNNVQDALDRHNRGIQDPASVIAVLNGASVSFQRQFENSIAPFIPFITSAIQGKGGGGTAGGGGGGGITNLPLNPGITNAPGPAPAPAPDVNVNVGGGFGGVFP